MNTLKGKTATTTGKGLFIPQKIYDIPDIKWAEKVLLSIIFHFDESYEKRVCYASDKYFAERLGYSKRNIRKILTKLEGLGMIQRRYEGEKRIIHVGEMFWED